MFRWRAPLAPTQVRVGFGRSPTLVSRVWHPDDVRAAARTKHKCLHFGGESRSHSHHTFAVTMPVHACRSYEIRNMHEYYTMLCKRPLAFPSAPDVGGEQRSHSLISFVFNDQALHHAMLTRHPAAAQPNVPGCGAFVERRLRGIMHVRLGENASTSRPTGT